MPSGGSREGTPGKAYGNRTDLQSPKPPKVGPSQQYGQNAALLRAQEAAPITPEGTPAAVGNQPAPFVPSVAPGGFPPLDRESERPDEPLTAGAPFGPGAGPMIDDSVAGQLRALYAIDGNEDVRELLELYDEGVF